MRIFNSLDEIGEIGETAAALGNFDGIIRETCWQEIMW